MVLGKLQCRGALLIGIIVGQGPIALAVGAGGSCLDISSLVYIFSCLSLSLKLKLKTPNQPNPVVSGMRTPVYSCYHVYSKVSDKNVEVYSDLTTHSMIPDSHSRRFVVV